MRVVFAPYNNPNYSTDTGHAHNFIITLNSFNFGTTCTVTNVVFEYSSSKTPGSGTNNSVPIDYTECDSKRIYLRLNNGRVFNTLWGNLPSKPFSDNIWHDN